MNKPNQLIILGGGTSVQEGIDKALWTKLQGKWTIGLNYSYNYFYPTILCYVDEDFYTQEKKRLDNLPLVIGKLHRDITTSDNIITLGVNDSKYIRNIKKGVYKSSLAGLFALSLSIYLLDEGEIFLLGFDYGDNGNKDKNNRAYTHFYQGDIHHRGIGKINYYKAKGRASRDFDVYQKEEKIKIYNVSSISNINSFPKITYNEFFKKLNPNNYCQEEIRNYVRNIL